MVLHDPLQVVLLFPHQFWPKGTDMFGHIAETTEERGDFFLFYSYADLAGALLGASAAVLTVRTVSREEICPA